MIYKRLIEKTASLAVVGLGYVGLPLAMGFAKKAKVIGFDINHKKIEQYKQGIDTTGEFKRAELSKSEILFTSQLSHLKSATVFIVAVPTPVNKDKIPDLQPLIMASEIVGNNLKKGDIVVFESTVYPGTTEEICIPILEEKSALFCNDDFLVGYSPERINPGDSINRLENITKIVSATNQQGLEEISKIYSLVVGENLHKASSIKVAEAAKVAENSQRDINIAFVNELAIVFEKMGIDTLQVIEAMNTKWNALGFRPGLVGGHCIGVDPYYFIYKAEHLGYHSQIVQGGRRINDYMGEFIAQTIINKLIAIDKTPKRCKIAILGITFKENCPDVRNTKVMDIVKKLEEYGATLQIVDPWADSQALLEQYNVALTPMEQVFDVDCLVIAVAHSQFKQLSLKEIDRLFKGGENNQKLIVDIKGALNKDKITQKGYLIWRL